jgi:hypothetical protein
LLDYFGGYWHSSSDNVMKKLCKPNFECIFVFSRRWRTIYVFGSLYGSGYLQSTEALKLERNSQTIDFAVAKVKR